MPAPLRLLLIEDSARDAALLVRMLQRAGYAVDAEQVETAEGARAALDRQEWDLVIADHTMPPLALMPHSRCYGSGVSICP